VDVTDAGFRVDPHVKVLDERVVRRAKALGLDALVYAPHFTRLPEIEERAAAHSDDELTVFPARELFTGSWQHRRHVLAGGLEDSVPDFLTLEATITELTEQGAAILVPHPGFLTVSLTSEEVNTYLDRLHGIEVYNPKHLPYHNRRARALARDTGLPAFASSYAHLRGTVGEAWIELEEPVETVDDLANALKDGAPRSVERRSGPRHQLRCAMEFAHLGYENSWGKVDRLFLQGTEATHPDHVAYGGRFDDVKVY
jgi:predicted metal-dependent phosphoesterase TrpH